MTWKEKGGTLGRRREIAGISGVKKKKRENKTEKLLNEDTERCVRNVGSFRLFSCRILFSKICSSKRARDLIKSFN